jgi:GR25 family glycosyltransferase involved in LPS biosynthesis
MKLTCHVINLDCKKEQYDHFTKTWEKYFSINRISAIDAKKQTKLNSKMCCKRSHLNLMKELVNKPTEDNFFIIMEDDVQPTEHFDKYWKDIYSYIKENHNYSFISLDLFLNLDKKRNQNVLENYNDILYRYTKSRNFGFTIYNKNYLTSFVKSSQYNELYENLIDPLDMTMTHDESLVKLTPKRLLVRQRTDKPSSIALNRHYIRHYDNWYDETDKILLNGCN